jgi:hypothetical protein
MDKQEIKSIKLQNPSIHKFLKIVLSHIWGYQQT